MNNVNGKRLIQNLNLPSPRAGNFHHALNHGMKEPGFFCICGFIVNFLSPPCTDDKRTSLQLFQVMGNSRR